MGLDMFVSMTAADSYDKEVDFEVIGEEWDFFYWRKHNALHGWFANLYHAKGGTDPSDGPVNINLADIDRLESDVRVRNLPKTVGFFFGSDSSQDPMYQKDDLEFIKKAREMLAKGMKIYYYASW